MQYTMGSLFAGIGGFDLGFERAGFKTSWQVEIDPYCQKVLAKNFPEAERFGDIRECGRHNLKPVDVICGGFPCQDISYAGLGRGIDGERSGLWSEFARIIHELRPTYVVVENVAALLRRGISRVLGDLAEVGYDAEWECISAADVGAPHLRERIWILAYPKGKQDSWILQPRIQANLSAGDWGNSEPGFCRVDDGVSAQVDRLRGLGNSVVPQIPEMIARRIKQALDCCMFCRRSGLKECDYGKRCAYTHPPKEISSPVESPTPNISEDMIRRGYKWEPLDGCDGCGQSMRECLCTPPAVQYQKLYEGKAKQLAGLIVSGHQPSIDKVARLLAREDAAPPETQVTT